MKTARHPSWNRSRFRQTGRAVKNKRAPDVRLVESGHQNQTHRLAQRFCWLEPAVPPPLPPSPLIPPLTFLFLPLSPPFLVCPFLYLSLLSFYTVFLLTILLLSIPILSPWNFPTLSFWLLFHAFVCELPGDNRAWGGWEGVFFFFLSFNSCC